jgi:hypothetical protein
MEKFKIELDRVIRVSSVIGRVDDQGRMNGDLSDCLSPDLKHLAELLSRILALEIAAPGFTVNMQAFLPHRIKLRKQAEHEALMQKKFDEMGFGEEWRGVRDAYRHPKKKDYMANVIAFNMKLHGMDQDQCIQAVARQSGESIESLRKAMTRYKNRIKT